VYWVLASGVGSSAVVWIREFLLGRTQRVTVGGHLSEEVRVTSGVPQGSVLGPGFGSGLEGSCMDKGIPAGPYTRVTVGGQLSEEVRVTSEVPQESVLGPGLWSGLESSCMDKGIPFWPYTES
jgi:hypothetical protein